MKNLRHKKILELIERYDIDTQEKGTNDLLYLKVKLPLWR